mmetsp:Transcript_28758/g.40504  ORF Transcript_28758/g.40504 Transcript_28758/m.40504 type:complete len:379 (+) Transcript_28758:17-1153(+)
MKAFISKISGGVSDDGSEFETQRQNWDNMVKSITQLKKDLKKQQKLQNLRLPFENVAESASLIFKNQEDTYISVLKGVSQQLAQALSQFSDSQQQLNSLVDNYLNYLLNFKSKIAERDNLWSEYEKINSQLKSYQEKPPKEPGKLQKTEEKMNQLWNLYQQSNSKLIEELKALYANRYNDFQKPYKVLVANQYMLFQRISAAYQTLESTSTSHNSAPSSSLPQGQTVLQALYDFQGNEKENELSFTKGDTIMVVEHYDNTAWWKGTNKRTNQTGLFPANFCGPAGQLNQISTSPQPQQTTIQQTTIQQVSPSVSTNQNSKRRICLYSYKAQDPSELSFSEKDIIVVLEAYENDQWWKGMNQNTKQVGVFPCNYTQENQ